ncbi:MAG: hypothetical protein ACTSU7_09270, partial [Candidatus Heimdallarchaeaceae archaeon]
MEPTKEQLLKIQQEYLEAKEQFDHYKAKVEDLKNQILELSQNQPFTGRLITLKKTQRIGNINWNKIAAKYKISPETQNS